MSSSLIQTLKQGQLVDTTKLDDEIDALWAAKKSTAKRHRISLPDLTDHINPNHQHTAHIVNKLIAFDTDRGGYSYHSLKMLIHVIKRWTDFIHQRGYYAFPLSAIDGKTFDEPAQTQVFIRFMKYLVLQDYSFSTLKQYRSQVSNIYRYLGLFNPAAQSEVTAFIGGIEDDFVTTTGERIQRKQAAPFMRHHLDELLAYRQNATLTPQKEWQLDKDIAIVGTAFATGLREGEITHLRKKHIRLETKCILIKRVRSKTSKNLTDRQLLGVFLDLFKRYYDKIADSLNDEQYVFSHFSNAGKPISPDVPMDGTTVDNAFGRCYQLLLDIGYETDMTRKWSGHSGRVGLLHYAHKMGYSDSEKQELGDWTDGRMPKLYLREYDNSVVFTKLQIVD
ncbi:tyrosine-type recombinase/integrase [Vibrio mediterranei]|uniref:tyrosine-type recombinase/integrase n=1 Tax=Vibrio mediterranei TaxID=689 RepID=UPI0038CE35CC